MLSERSSRTIYQCEPFKLQAREKKLGEFWKEIFHFLVPDTFTSIYPFLGLKKFLSDFSLYTRLWSTDLFHNKINLRFLSTYQ